MPITLYTKWHRKSFGSPRYLSLHTGWLFSQANCTNQFQRKLDWKCRYFLPAEQHPAQNSQTTARKIHKLFSVWRKWVEKSGVVFWRTCHSFRFFRRKRSKMDWILLLVLWKVTFSPYRSENSVKNKFYGSIRKTLRKINDFGRKYSSAFSKPIKYETLIRVLDLEINSDSLSIPLQTLAKALKNDILSFSQFGIE